MPNAAERDQVWLTGVARSCPARGPVRGDGPPGHPASAGGAGAARRAGTCGQRAPALIGSGSSGNRLRAASRRGSMVVSRWNAWAAFTEQGADVHMASIAERANVGIGTVYRHFPTKQALVNAILADRL